MKQRKKRSAIWTIPKTDLEIIVKQSESFSDILRRLEIFTGAANRSSLLRRLQQENISVDHIPRGLGANRGKKYNISRSKHSHEELFNEKSFVTRAVLKRRILKENLIPYVCSGEGCVVKDSWNSKPLMLVLDHINGISNDHRLENLRFLCPNCNSQSDTFCGRNIKYEPIPKSKKDRPKKINISIEEMNELTKTLNKSQIAKKLGVSETAIRKFINRKLV